MDEQLRDRAVDEHQELFGNQLLSADVLSNKMVGEPILKGALVMCNQLGDAIVSMLRQFADGACKRAAMPARVLRLLREQIEKRFDLSDHIAIGVVLSDFSPRC